MDNQIFRKKSLERISSPDDMRKYLRISSPGLWMILSVILALLIGFIIYASVVTMENTISTQAVVTNYTEVEELFEEPFSLVMIRIPYSYDDIIEIGMEVRINGMKGRITGISRDENEIWGVVEMSDKSVLIPSGDYDAEIVMERISPLSFLMN